MALHWNSICMPTDFSEASRPAFHMAVDLAAHFEAELRLVYVQKLPPIAYSVMPLQGGVRDEMDADALALLERWKKEAEAKGARRTSVAMLSGEAVSAEIVGFAERNHADLIVMGTNGRTALAHVMMGSVAEEVVRRAKCPVLTFRARKLHAVRDTR